MDHTADSFQVSPQQEQLWASEPDGPSARTQALAVLRGRLSQASLEAGLRGVSERHESIRTTFLRQPGLRIPLQVVNEALVPGFRAIDLREFDPDARAARRSTALLEEFQRPFDLADGPLVTALLLREAEDRHELALTVSSLCADPASVRLLLGELLKYHAGAGELVEDPLQYADFSAWQRGVLDSEEDEARSAADFWASMQQVEAPELPFATAATSPGCPDEIEVEIDGSLAEAVRSSAATYGVSGSAFVQAAWHALLGGYSSAEAVAVAYLTAERRHADLDGAIGAFSRPVPIRTAVEDEVTFAEVLQTIDHARDDALAWQDYAPVERPNRFPVGFVASEPYRWQSDDLAGTLERLTPTAPFRLWLTCIADEQDVFVQLGFYPHSHRREIAQRLARGLSVLLRQVSADTGARLADLNLLDETERSLLLEQFNETAVEIPETALHDLIASVAESAPERDAVRDERGSISYRELDARANQLAQRLIRCGAGPDVGVALCTDRSVDMVVGLLGILKAGSAYVPLHYEHPPARLAHQLRTAGVKAIVTQEALLDRLPEFTGEIVCLDRDRPQLDAEPATRPDTGVTPDGLAYVIFTSGSTGTPKGVEVTHRNVVNYASDVARRLGADTEPLSFGVVTSISTDLGNTSIFGALCSSGTIVLIPPAAAADSAAMARQLSATPVDVLKITPSHLGALLVAGGAAVLPRRCVVLGGEALPWDLLERVRSLSQCRILNHYGPTETTIGSCTFSVGDGRGEYEPATVPIGRPIANTSCYVLDNAHRPVPLGVAGRLFIAGAGVARGYAGDPETTATRFADNPFAGGRMYDTGDLVRWLPDGTLEFLRRADEQVKIRGYRVEPGEVETALRSHPAVREASALVRKGSSSDPRLVVYCAADGGVTQAELRAHLAEWLPEYMLPSAIAMLDTLPRTPSGKVDRLALPDPETLGSNETEFVAPKTPMEEAVAAIWSQMLGVARVGVEDDFFELGGHSLLATQVVAQVRSEFAVDLPLHSLFTHPTVATLTEEIVRMMGAAEDDETARLMAELEGMSEEVAERMLAEEDSAGPHRST